MNQVGDVGNPGSCPGVADAAQDYLSARGQDRIETDPLLGQHLHGIVVSADRF